MSKASVIPIQLRAVVPTSGGTAVFLGNEDKIFLIYVDNAVGAAIAMHLGKVKVPRPQTHDLIERMLLAFGARIERVVINDFSENTFFARLILSIENEVRERKLIELDARPSDSIALALRGRAPLYVAETVWNEVSDMSHLLKAMEDAGTEPISPEEDEEDDDDFDLGGETGPEDEDED